MNDKIFKYIKYLLYVLLGAGVAVFLYWLIASFTNSEIDPQFTTVTATKGSAMGVDVMLTYTYILFAIALVLAVVFPVVNIVRNPKGGMRALMGLCALLVMVGIGWIMSSDAPVRNSAGGYFENPFTLRMTDVELYVGYIMLVVAFVVILFTEIRNALK